MFITRRGGILKNGSSESTTTEIISVDSKDSLPANTTPGAIAIISGIPVTNVCVQTDEPESPTNGDLWLTTGTGFTVIYVQDGTPYAIVAAKQYIDGAWVAVVTSQFVNGVWSGELYLLKGADFCEGITGGWTKSGNGTFAISGERIKLYSGAGVGGTTHTTNNTIDISSYKTMYFDVGSVSADLSLPNANNVCNLYIRKDGANVISYSLTSKGLKTIDVSGITGQVSIRLYTYSYNAGTTITVYINGLWLE